MRFLCVCVTGFLGMSLKLKNIHMLVVEDIQPMRELVISVLKALGVGTISFATDGKSGYEAYCRYRPDIVLTDWSMGEHSGLELTKRIRTDPSSPDKMVPIILMTGYGSPAYISQARNCGSTEYLVKPFSARDLSKRLNHIIKSPRDFIITDTFAGPDRRRREDPFYSGPSNRIHGSRPKQLIKPSPALQAKAGLGLIDEQTIEKSQSLFDKFEIDFKPIAMAFLNDTDEAISLALQEKETTSRSIERIADPVMQIKANAKIFKYTLIGDLAAIILNFLDNLTVLDQNALEILDAHRKSLRHLISHDIKGDIGPLGESFKTELEGACKRYMQSRAEKLRKNLQAAIDSNAS